MDRSSNRVKLKNNTAAEIARHHPDCFDSSAHLAKLDLDE
jgi:hypothetical protein